MAKYFINYLIELFEAPIGRYKFEEHRMNPNNVLAYSIKNKPIRYSTPLGRVLNDVKRHKKGYFITALAEAGWLKYLYELRSVASDALVEAGLKMGKVIKYPIKPELFGWPPWPHIVDIRGQTPIEPIYETNAIVHAILSIGRDPAILGALASIPIIVYGAYRVWKYKKGKKK